MPPTYRAALTVGALRQFLNDEESKWSDDDRRELGEFDAQPVYLDVIPPGSSRFVVSAQDVMYEVGIGVVLMDEGVSE